MFLQVENVLKRKEAHKAYGVRGLMKTHDKKGNLRYTVSNVTQVLITA